jgi:SAM-dependent methyltransferase
MRRCLACMARFDGEAWACPSCDAAPRVVDGVPIFAPELAAGSGGDAAYLYADLAAAEERHFWFQARQRLILRALRRHFPRAGRLLEIGCGTGFILAGVRREFPGIVLAGSDSRTEGLAFAAARLPGVELLQMDARHIPFRAEFDVIGAFDVIEHIDDDEAALAEMREAVRPGGGIVLTVPQHPWLWSEVDAFSHHKRRYTRNELLAKLHRVGFQPARVTSFCSVVLPLLAAARLRSRLSPRAFDPAAELRISDLANGVGKAASYVEDAVTSLGVGLPAGGSLLVVAMAGATR